MAHSQSLPIGESADCCVILAGYAAEMDGFMNNPSTNRGLKSRFNYDAPWVFEDMSDADLAVIFRNKCAREGVAYSPPVRDRFIQHLGRMRGVLGFANVRTLETLVAAGRAALQKRQVRRHGGGRGACSVLSDSMSCPVQHEARAAGREPPRMLEFMDLVPDAPDPDVAHLLFADAVAVPSVRAYVDEVISVAKVAAAEGRDPAKTLASMNVCLLGPPGEEWGGRGRMSGFPTCTTWARG